MFRSKGSIAAWLVGGITLVSLAFFLFSSWFSTPGVPRIEFKSQGEEKVDPVEEVEDLEDDDEEDEEEEEDEGADVEDVEEEDEEDSAEKTIPSASRSEEANKEDHMKVLKAQYDAASKECSALIASQKFAEAVDKLSELIGLAGKVQRGQTEIVTLYNNRSAMFEKIQEYEKALSDIRVMLLMQRDHVRARARRARIYEAQGLLEEAVEEYVICNWIEQSRREMVSYGCCNIHDFYANLHIDSPLTRRELPNCSRRSPSPRPPGSSRRFRTKCSLSPPNQNLLRFRLTARRQR